MEESNGDLCNPRPNQLLQTKFVCAAVEQLHLQRRTPRRAKRIPQTPEHLYSLWHINICGLDRRHHQLESEMMQYGPDIVGLTETHHTETPTEIQGYTFVGSNAPTPNKSGTGLYIRDFKGTS